MLRAFTLTSSLILISACQTPAEVTEVDTPSACYFGGPIYTAVDDQPQLTGVMVAGGEISDITANENGHQWCSDLAGSNTDLVDLDGAAMFPGFTDAHVHLLGVGERELTLNLEDTKSVSDLIGRVETALAAEPKPDVIVGRGWIETHWPENRFPNRQDLDQVAPDTPVILSRADGHAVVVNSAALEAANITRQTQAPFGGDILKDDAGEPTGMLIDRAEDLVSDLIPDMTEARIREAYELGAQLYASRGWTNVHSMSVNPGDVAIQKSLPRDAFPLRVYNAVDVSDGFDPETFDQAPDGQITKRAIKLYSDGALGSRGAALLEPYADDTDNSGLLLAKYEEVMPILTSALEGGVQVNMHAIGDRANRLVLDWFEEAMNAVPPSERAVANPRWRIEHAQILNLEDIPRFSELDIIPSMQPSHAIGDLHFAVDRIGADRLQGGYAWRRLIDSGAIIAGGSDAPVEVGDPRIEFYAAVARQDQSGFSNENWYPDQKVTRQEALKMFTAWPAYAAFQDTQLGTIEVGKAADFTVFDQDIMSIPEDAILGSNVVMTIIDGEIVFEAAAD